MYNKEFGEDVQSVDNFDKYTITTKNVKIYRKDKNANYEVLESDKQPLVTVITVSKLDIDTEIDKIQNYLNNIFNNINKQINSSIKNILILDPIELFLVEKKNNSKLKIIAQILKQFSDSLIDILDIEIIFTKPNNGIDNTIYNKVMLSFNLLIENYNEDESKRKNKVVMDESFKVSIGGNTNNSKLTKSKLTKSKSPKHKTNTKNTKKNNSRKKKSKNNIARNKSKLSKLSKKN
jgi:hypothetical protein